MRDKYGNTCRNFENGFIRQIPHSHHLLSTSKKPKRQNCGVCNKRIRSVTAVGGFLFAFVINLCNYRNNESIVWFENALACFLRPSFVDGCKLFGSMLFGGDQDPMGWMEKSFLFFLFINSDLKAIEIPHIVSPYWFETIQVYTRIW